MAKDRHQACVLCAALASSHPGALESAVAEVPKRASRHLRMALAAVEEQLEEVAPRALEELRG